MYKQISFFKNYTKLSKIPNLSYVSFLFWYHQSTGPLTCQLEYCLISRIFLVVPECPTPLLGRDILGSLQSILWLGGPKKPLFSMMTVFYKQ